MSVNCPPAPLSSTCKIGHGGCIPDFSQPSAKFCCSNTCSGGNLPNVPLTPCPSCPGASFPEDCPQNICSLSALARIIVTIVQIRDSDGVTNHQILQEHNSMVCPEDPLTLEEVSRNVNLGVRRGALKRVSSGEVRVYAFFGELPSNMGLMKELGVYYQLCLGLFCNNGR